MGEGDAGGGSAYQAVPPPPPAAAAQPAAPGTIFRRRLVLGGGYQPPIRHGQPTQLSASGRRCQLRPRTPGRREGSGRRTRSGPSALEKGPGVRGPRPVRAEGPGRQGDREAAQRARQGRGHDRGWVCYCRLRLFLRGACRETAGGGGGAHCAARAAQRDVCAGPEVGGSPEKGRLRLRLRRAWLSSPDPAMILLGLPLVLLVAVWVQTSPR